MLRALEASGAELLDGKGAEPAEVFGTGHE
jgi:hypothetical protein